MPIEHLSQQILVGRVNIEGCYSAPGTAPKSYSVAILKSLFQRSTSWQSKFLPMEDQWLLRVRIDRHGGDADRSILALIVYKDAHASLTEFSRVLASPRGRSRESARVIACAPAHEASASAAILHCRARCFST